MNAIETIDYKGMLIEVHQDELDESPREWDNLGTMVCFHGRYELGDTGHGYDHDDYSSWNELAEDIQRREDVAVILPLYLYDHSGLRMKVGSFNGLLPQGHAEFDSGQVGWIYITKQQIRKKYGAKRVTLQRIERVERLLRGEVNTYDQYLSGQIYGYVALDPGTGDTIDSCWGFYGDPGDDMLPEARSAIDCHLRRELARKIRKIKALINNHVPLHYRPAILSAV